MELTVPVSLGELLDKYSILDIKNRRIANPDKIRHVQAEMKVLDALVQPWLKIMPHYYRYLVHINETIWDLSDQIRENPKDTQKCMDIIIHNDRRFRVKNKINRHSILKEQKSYPQTRCVFVGHCGAGDCMTNTGIVRYLSTCYDEVIVIVKVLSFHLTKGLYRDDPGIQVIADDRILGNNHDLAVLRDLYEKEYRGKVYMVKPLLIGVQNFDKFYDEFYVSVDVPPAYRFIYGYVPPSETQQAKPDRSYIFVHQRHHHPITSEHQVIYANSHVPILDYIEIMKGAEELHLDDSAFFCLANLLDLSQVKKLVVYFTYHHGYDLKGYCNPKQNWMIQ